MTGYAALLRAVNVGGTGKVAMTELRALGERCGFARVRTFIASGNLLFDSDAGEAAIEPRIERELEELAGKRIAVFIRTAAEMAEVAAANPFVGEPGNRVVAMFLKRAPEEGLAERLTGVGTERVALGRREVYIAYPDGMADSRLKLPADVVGTARNMNSVAKMAALLA